MISYISPSSLNMFYTDRVNFYLTRLSPNRLGHEPQTQHMSAGSGFDAYVKAYLVGQIYGNEYPDYEFEALFESQVEDQNREYARKWGYELFKVYKEGGGLANLMLELQASNGEPRFEKSLQATVGGIPLLGKPDLSFRVRVSDLQIVHDWKVTSTVSPKPNYILARYNGGRKSPIAYKDTFVSEYKGVKINIGCNLEDINPSWAIQLAIYGWLLGSDPNEEQVGSIDLLTDYLNIEKGRVVSYRNKIGSEFQKVLLERIQKMWQLIQEDWIFDEMSKEESQEYCRTLDSTVSGDDLFRRLTLGR